MARALCLVDYRKVFPLITILAQLNMVKRWEENVHVYPQKRDCKEDPKERLLRRPKRETVKKTQKRDCKDGPKLWKFVDLKLDLGVCV